MKRIAIALLATAVGVGLMSSAYAADLIVSEPEPVGVVDVGGNWDGPYVGVFAGYGWGKVEETDTTNLGFPDDVLDLSGWLLGATVGANFSSGGVVFGVAADLAWSDVGAEWTDITGVTTFDVDWTASLRGRIGYDGGAFLPYLTAGLAVAGATAFDDPDPSETATYVGWTVGAGVEFAVADNVSLDLAYRYSDYGSQDYDLGYGDFPLALTTHQFTVGVNYGF